MLSFTVILVQYNPDREKLMRTVESIVRQKDISLQIIVADDCSNRDYFSDIEQVMRDHSIDNYYFCKNETNQGTVINIWNALRKAKGCFISLISPGDYYYDEKTLSEVYETMHSGEFEFAFGRLCPYHCSNNEIKLVDVEFPLCLSPYREYMKTYDNSRLEKNLVLYNDTMVGPSLFWKKEMFIYYLSRIVDKVRYIEDLLPKFVILDKKKFCYMDRYVIWYEYGSGLSTSSSKAFQKRIDEDTYSFYNILSQYYPYSTIVSRAKRLGEVVRIGGIKSRILRSIMFPDRFIYILMHKTLLKEKKKQPDTSFILDLYQNR